MATNDRTLVRVTALAAIVVPSVYLASKVVETLEGGEFSDLRLVLTYLGEAGLPFVLLGLWAVQRPAAGGAALLGSVLYAYAFVFFTGTVVYALAADAPDWPAVVDRFGPWLTVHGVVMVAGGLLFGLGVARAGVLPPWTGVTLAVGVVLVALTSPAPDAARALAAALPNVALVAMGWSVLRMPTARSHQLGAAPPNASLPGGRAL
jgi:hypothetical protein